MQRKYHSVLSLFAILLLILQFCLNCLSLIVEKYSCSDRDDLQSEIMSTAGEVFGLANNLNIEDEILWKSFTLELFSSGLDNAAYEVNS